MEATKALSVGVRWGPVRAAVNGTVVARPVSTTPVGVSGAMFLLPVQVSLLSVPSPAVTPTNLLFNVVATPGGLLRYAAGAGLTKDLVNDARDGCGGVDYNTVLRNVFFV